MARSAHAAWLVVSVMASAASAVPGENPLAPGAPRRSGLEEHVIVRDWTTNVVNVSLWRADGGAEACEEVDPSRFEVRVRGEAREIVRVTRRGGEAVTIDAPPTATSGVATPGATYVLFVDGFIGGGAGVGPLIRTLEQPGVFGPRDRFLLVKWSAGDVSIDFEPFDDPRQAAFMLPSFLAETRRPLGNVGSAIFVGVRPPASTKRHPSVPGTEQFELEVKIIGKEDWLRQWKQLIASLGWLPGRKVVLLPTTGTPNGIGDADARARLTELAVEADVEVHPIDLYAATDEDMLAPGLPYFAEATGGHVFRHRRHDADFAPIVRELQQRLRCGFSIEYKARRGDVEGPEPGTAVDYRDARFTVERPKYVERSIDARRAAADVDVTHASGRLLLRSAGSGFRGSVDLMLERPRAVDASKHDEPRTWSVYVAGRLGVPDLASASPFRELHAFIGVYGERSPGAPVYALHHRFSGEQMASMLGGTVAFAHRLPKPQPPGSYRVLMTVQNERRETVLTASSTFAVPRTFVHRVPYDTFQDLDTPRWIVVDGLAPADTHASDLLPLPNAARELEPGAPFRLWGYACPKDRLLRDRHGTLHAELRSASGHGTRTIAIVPTTEDPLVAHDDGACHVFVTAALDPPLEPGGWTFVPPDELMPHGPSSHSAIPLRLWVKCGDSNPISEMGLLSPH